MSKWIDTTAYGPTSKGEAKAWTYPMGDFDVVVHRWVGCGDRWLISTRQLNFFDKEFLQAKDIDEAKEEALLGIYTRLNNLAEKVLQIAGEVTVP